MTMSDAVNPYTFHSAGCTSAAHFMMQVGFCEPEYPLCFRYIFQGGDILPNLLRKEIRHQHTTDTFICFRWGNDIFALDALIRLCNMNDLVFKKSLTGFVKRKKNTANIIQKPIAISRLLKISCMAFICFPL